MIVHFLIYLWTVNIYTIREKSHVYMHKGYECEVLTDKLLSVNLFNIIIR